MIFSVPQFWKEKTNCSYQIFNKGTPFYENFLLMRYDDQNISLGKAPGILEQKQLIKSKLTKRERKVEKVWFVICKKWFDKWKKYVAFKSKSNSRRGFENPGPIDNSEIIEYDWEKFRTSKSSLSRRPLVKLKKRIIENIDFKTIPRKVWDLLLKWYGGKHGGYAPTIARLSYGYPKHSQVIVDLYPMFLNCCFSGNNDKPLLSNFKNLRTYNFEESRGKAVEFVELRISYKYESIDFFRKFLMEFYGTTSSYSSVGNECRSTKLWISVGGEDFVHLTNEDCSFMAWDEEKRMRNGDFIILEPRFLTKEYFTSPVRRFIFYEEVNSEKVKKQQPFWKTQKYPFTSFVSLSCHDKERDVVMKDYIKKRVFDPWEKSFSPENTEFEVSKSRKIDKTNKMEFNQKYWVNDGDYYLVFRFNDEYYREFVVVKILEIGDDDVFYSERMEYMLDMKYDISNVYILKLSIIGEKNCFDLEIGKIFF